MTSTTEPPTLGPADVADQVPAKKTRKAKAKIDRLLNPIANELETRSPLLVSEGVKLCGHLSPGEPVTEDKILTLERLVRADERFVVFIQDGKKHIALASDGVIQHRQDLDEQGNRPSPVQPVQRTTEAEAVATLAQPATLTLSEQLEKQAAFEQQVQAEAGVPGSDEPTTTPASDAGAAVPTLGELADQVVAEAAAAPVMETISKLPTATERLQFELNCYMTRAAKVRVLGQHYQQLKSAQAELQGELTDIHKQLKDTAKKLADLAVERVDLTFQDPIPFATAPEDGATAADAGLKDEHGEPVVSEDEDGADQAGPDPQQTISLGNPDLTHIDNPGSGAATPPAPPEAPLQFPLDQLAAATPADDDMDAPPNPVGSE